MNNELKRLDFALELAKVMWSKYPENFNPERKPTVNADVITAIECILANARNGWISYVAVSYISSSAEVEFQKSYGDTCDGNIQKVNPLEAWRDTSFEIGHILKRQYPSDFDQDVVSKTDKKVIVLLDRMLANARAGTISDVVICYIKSNGDNGSTWSDGVWRRLAKERRLND